MKNQEQYYQSGLLPMPKPKPKLASFRKYYTKSLEAHNSLCQSTKKKQKTIIDEFLIQKIQKLVPSKIEKEFSKRKSLSQKLKTEKNQIQQYSMSKHQQMMENFKRRSLQLSKQAMLSQNRVNKLAHKKIKRINPFDIQDIDWAQQRWSSKQKQQKKGKYSQKLHPICLIYQQTADKILANRRVPQNPFQEFSSIQFV